MRQHTDMLAAAFKNAIAPDRELAWSEAIIISIAVTCVALPAVAALYLAKSALGINVLASPSPLHDLLYGVLR